MARLILVLTALLVGAATPAMAGPAEDSAARDARNAEVVFSQYPARALAAREQGPVYFKVTLDRDGYASACEVTRGSGYPRLDEETCNLILNRAEFKGVKGAHGRKVSTVAEGVVNWRLPGAAVTSPPPTVMASAAKPEKKVCRRRVKTGSLADYERLCATQADWDRMSDQTRREWGVLQGTSGSTHGG
jgi:TonB family protein